ncbi:hypothetical protein R3W88_029848 [Solanum pinnatisectum]|uniref:RNase H type-1 domain-containing protein n=1 Tax=Solanum pinnatisectum TaxID=50273 RepID=A0AAV9K6I0_9SOLN|nr:hypothetical protein R3W88_029848 [Solanum pinnatisectum]
MQFVKLPMNVIKCIDKVQRNFIWGTTDTRKKMNVDAPYKWLPPPYGFKLNVDGSFEHTTSKGGAWSVIRDFNGNWIVGKSSRISTNSVLNAELLALIQGLQFAQSQGILDIIIAMDSAEVIKMLEEKK